MTATNATLAVLYKVQRATFALWAAITGAFALLSIILPQVVVKLLGAKALAGQPVIYFERDAAARLGLALVALVCAFTPRPPRALVWIFFVLLVAGVVGPALVMLAGSIARQDLHALDQLPHLDLACALVLLVTQEWRALLVRRMRRAS